MTGDDRRSTSVSNTLARSMLPARWWTLRALSNVRGALRQVPAPPQGPARPWPLRHAFTSPLDSNVGEKSSVDLDADAETAQATPIASRASSYRTGTSSLDPDGFPPLKRSVSSTRMPPPGPLVPNAGWRQVGSKKERRRGDPLLSPSPLPSPVGLDDPIGLSRSSSWTDNTYSTHSRSTSPRLNDSESLAPVDQAGTVGGDSGAGSLRGTGNGLPPRSGILSRSGSQVNLSLLDRRMASYSRGAGAAEE